MRGIIIAGALALVAALPAQAQAILECERWVNYRKVDGLTATLADDEITIRTERPDLMNRDAPMVVEERVVLYHNRTAADGRIEGLWISVVVTENRMTDMFGDDLVSAPTIHHIDWGNALAGYTYTSYDSKVQAVQYDACRRLD